MGAFEGKVLSKKDGGNRVAFAAIFWLLAYGKRIACRTRARTYENRLWSLAGTFWCLYSAKRRIDCRAHAIGWTDAAFHEFASLLADDETGKVACL